MKTKSVHASSRHRTRDGWERGIISRAALGATVVALGVAATPMIVGCKAVGPIIADVVIKACPQIIAKICGLGGQDLPPGYTQCGAESWKIRGHELKFCFYCPDDRDLPMLVQLNCEGKYHCIEPLPRPKPTRADSGYDSESPQILSLECAAYLATMAQVRVDESLRHADATIIMPNDRMLPDARGFLDITVEVDGRPADRSGSDPVDKGAAVRVHGDFNEVARFAAEAGVTSLEFRDDGKVWNIEVNPKYAAVAVFRNDRLVESRLLFTPELP